MHVYFVTRRWKCCTKLDLLFPFLMGAHSLNTALADAGGRARGGGEGGSGYHLCLLSVHREWSASTRDTGQRDRQGSWSRVALGTLLPSFCVRSKLWFEWKARPLRAAGSLLRAHRCNRLTCTCSEAQEPPMHRGTGTPRCV